MAQLFECLQILEHVEKELMDMSKSMNIEYMKSKLEALENEMVIEGFWDDVKKSKETLKEIKIIKEKVEGYHILISNLEDIQLNIEILKEEFVEEEAEDIFSSLEEFKIEVDKFVLSNLLKGEHDLSNAIISIHPGAGGVESQDWANMLLRMFTRFCEKNSYKVKILDYLSGETAGIKSVTMLVEGSNAYGFLKAEKGVHRLVRLSPFDSANRRHTSFASVDVMPEIDDSITLNINLSDLKIDTFRAGGAGGQHVNKTDSAVRITHLPTGVVVSCQNERSQFQNKDTALKILKGKLIEIMEEEKKDELEQLKGNYGQIAWGNQIRSYVMHPYTLVKDHRTKVEISDVAKVMDGEIYNFIDAFLKGIE